MSIFKDKAKKLMADMRQARNRGTCRYVEPNSEAEENFIGHVQQVMGIHPEEIVNGSPKVMSFNNNNNSTMKNHNLPKSSMSFATAVEQVLKDRKGQQADVAILNNGVQHMSIGFRGEKYHRNEIPYDIPLEVAVTKFNQKWGDVERLSRRKNSQDSSGSFVETQDGEKKVNDFHLLKTIGKGAFGKVILVQCRLTGVFYAMKVIDKKRIIETGTVKGVLNEKRVLQCTDFPFLVKMFFHFQDAGNLFMVMEYVAGGDLFFHLKHKLGLSEKEAQFYGGQIILAIEYLHSANVIYRDLKPENILINYDGYIKLTDFGLAKRLATLGHTRSMVGTAEYLAPEIFLRKVYGKNVDWWSLGVLLYEMFHGKTPFRSPSETETFEKILSGKIKFGQTTPAFKALVKSLINDDISARLGSRSVDDIKRHPWFESLSWNNLLAKKIEPPFIPRLHHRGDTRFFDKYPESLTCITHLTPSEEDLVKEYIFDF